jgi:hypothetical protein
MKIGFVFGRKLPGSCRQSSVNCIATAVPTYSVLMIGESMSANNGASLKRVRMTPFDFRGVPVNLVGVRGEDNVFFSSFSHRSTILERLRL